MIDLRVATLLIAAIGGCYAAVIGAYVFAFNSYKNLSNHMNEKLDSIDKELSGFKADTNRALGRIEGAINSRKEGTK